MFSPARLIRSFGYAWAGITHVGRTQPNWQIHIFIAAVAAGAGFVLQISLLEWAIVALTIGLVLAFESLNTAVEATVDALNSPPTLTTKHAKDAAAGAVLLMAITAVMVGVLIYGPRLASLVYRVH